VGNEVQNKMREYGQASRDSDPGGLIDHLENEESQQGRNHVGCQTVRNRIEIQIQRIHFGDAFDDSELFNAQQHQHGHERVRQRGQKKQNAQVDFPGHFLGE
jgi:hypothetical protein